MDYLEYGTYIIDRLKDQLDHITVLTSDDLTDVTETAQILPAAHVYFSGESFGDSAGKGVSHVVTQKWTVVIAVRNLKKSTQPLGAIVAETIKALQGYQVNDPKYGALYREQAQAPVYNPGGYIYFPLTFSVRFITTGLWRE